MTKLSIFIIIASSIFNIECAAINDYVLHLYRSELVEHNSSLLDMKLVTQKIDRYNYGTSANLTPYTTLTNNLTINVQVFEFLSNEYRPIALTIRRHFCDFMNIEYKNIVQPGLNQLKEEYMPSKCPIIPGKYYFVNFSPKASSLPSGLPMKNCYFEFKLFSKKITYFKARVYFKFDRDAFIRKQFT